MGTEGVNIITKKSCKGDNLRGLLGLPIELDMELVSKFAQRMVMMV
jgi:hypothetical protein